MICDVLCCSWQRMPAVAPAVFRMHGMQSQHASGATDLRFKVSRWEKPLLCKDWQPHSIHGGSGRSTGGSEHWVCASHCTVLRFGLVSPFGISVVRCLVNGSVSAIVTPIACQAIAMQPVPTAIVATSEQARESRTARVIARHQFFAPGRNGQRTTAVARAVATG